MDNFRGYLENKRYSAATIGIYTRYAGIFLKWMVAENQQAETVKYSDIISFIEYLQSENTAAAHINKILNAIRHYYNYLIHCKTVERNPASGINLKGINRKTICNLLDKDELETLNEMYKTTDLRTQRNKTILGLLVYQAITTQELHKLRPEHIKLKEGKITIPGSPRSNGRTLKLESSQIMDLHEYINTTRPKILGKNTSNQLFVSMELKETIKNTLKHLFAALKKINPNLKNAKQIRMSVIRNRLKETNLREVQYFAGHKYVSSTERYKTDNLEDLQKEVEKHHPLK